MACKANNGYLINLNIKLFRLMMSQTEFNRLLKRAIDEGVLYIMEKQYNYNNPYESWLEDTNYVITHD